jgi:hypothetical protein
MQLTQETGGAVSGFVVHVAMGVDIPSPALLMLCTNEESRRGCFDSSLFLNGDPMVL